MYIVAKRSPISATAELLFDCGYASFVGAVNRSCGVDVTVVACLPSCSVSGVGESSRGDEFLPESSICIGESFPESAKPGSGDSTAIGCATENRETVKPICLLTENWSNENLYSPD